MLHTNVAQHIVREFHAREIERRRQRPWASRRPVRRSAAPSAAASSRSASGSLRSHRSSWPGPARGRVSSPEPKEILS